MADSSFTVENFQYKQMVEQETAPSAPLPMITVSFSGSGLADLTAGTAFNQVAMATFIITIAGTGSPNTFDWTKTGGSGSSSASGVSITGSAQTLDDGFQITFGATTGHTAGNAWTIKCLPRARMYWDSTGAIQQKWSNGTTTSVGGGAPSGSAGGDLGGTYPNPTVAKINGATVGTATATSGNLLIGSGTAWVTNAVSGDVTINSTGVTAIGATKVTNAMLAGSIQASKLVGTDITTVGTITSGTWNGTAIAASYLANTAVTPGSYTTADITVDAQGRITAASSGTVTPTAINDLGDATGAGSVANAANAQTWTWNTLASGQGLALTSTSTAAASNTQNLLYASLSGANGTSTQTTYTSYMVNTHTGTSSTNIAGYFGASGGTNNYGLYVGAGDINVGTSLQGNVSNETGLQVTTTVSPYIRLHRPGSAEYRIGLYSTDNNLYITNNNGPTALGTSLNGITVTSAGLVGINIATATSLLHIQQKADSTNTSTPVAFNINSVGAAGELTASSSVQTFAQIAPTVNQSGTAGYTALKINSTQTATGSGSKLLTDWQVGGTSLGSFNSSGQFTFAQGTITSSLPFIDHSATLNSGGTTFTVLKSNITDTASLSGTNLFDFQVAGTSKGALRKDGLLTTTGGVSTTSVSASSGYTTNSGNYIWQANTTYNAWQANGFAGGTMGIVTGISINARTTDQTLSGTTDTNILTTNTGASGSVTITLPAASVGLTYRFAVTAAQNLIVDAAGTDTIRIAASVTAAGGTLTSNTIGNTLIIVCVKSGEWFVMAHEGTWTVA